jgi:nucleoside-diphosphate-sugar epimerase
LPPVVLVVGATGIVGRRVTQAFQQKGCVVYGLCRRPPRITDGWRPVAADLVNAQGCFEAIRSLGGVTHVFYAARHSHADQGEPVEKNVQMLANVLDAVEQTSPGLQHVHAVHGMKVYGSTLGPYKTPARETDPPTLTDTFYFGQHALLTRRQQGKSWTWSISRPQTLCDDDIDQLRNLPRLIAVYAALCKARGMRELNFPGTAQAFYSLYQVTHAALLARAIAWMAFEPRCANEVFNVTNGDSFRWIYLWPQLAEHFGLRAGQPRALKLAQLMASKGPEWDALVQEHDLLRTPFSQAALWHYGDYIFGFQYDVLSDQTKLRRFGFHEFVDSEAMFLDLLRSLRDQRLTPW